MGRRKVNHLDPIRVRGILYDVEPVMFVDTLSEEELIKMKEEKKAAKK